MRSIFLIAFANISRRRLQSTLVAGCMALSALLFLTTLGVMNGIREPFDVVFNQLNASHLLLFYDVREQDTEELVQWFRAQPEVESVADAVPYHTLSRPIIHRGGELDLAVQLTEHHVTNLKQDRVRIYRGTAQAHPTHGEIWIPNHLAVSHHIQLGDTLGIPIRTGLYPLVVSATLIDPHYVSSLFNPTRAWIAPGSLPFFLPISQLEGRMLGIRVTATEDVDSLWSRFTRAHLFTGHLLPYQLFKATFLGFYQIISLVLLVFSSLALLATIFILFTTLSGTIAADYRSIGIYKAQGLTPYNIKSIYLLQYLALAILVMPISLSGAHLITEWILSSLVRSVGLVQTGFSFFQLSMLATLLFILLVALLTWVGSHRAGKISPAQAIRQGAASAAFGQSRLSAFSLNLPVVLLLGSRLVWMHPKRLVYTLISMLFALFLLIFSLNLGYSFRKITDNKPAWGFEDSDLQLRLNQQVALPLEHASFLDFLRQEEAVAEVVPYGYCQASVPANDRMAQQELHGKVYNGPLAGLGLVNLQGYHPVQADEIALCVGTAEELSKRPGDHIALFLEGQQRDFKVTGIYQDVSNLGRGFRLPGSAMQELNPLYQPDIYALRLTDSKMAEDFQLKLQRAFGETVTIELSVEQRKEIQHTLGNMYGTLVLIALFFLSILFAALYNDTLLNGHEFRRSFGIFKAIGWTPTQIRRALVIRMVWLTLFCILIGIPLTLWLTPPLINGITSGIGLKNFPLLVHIWGMILVVPGLLLFTGLSVWWASRRIARIHPQVLVVN